MRSPAQAGDGSEVGNRGRGRAAPNPLPLDARRRSAHPVIGGRALARRPRLSSMATRPQYTPPLAVASVTPFLLSLNARHTQYTSLLSPWHLRPALSALALPHAGRSPRRFAVRVRARAFAGGSLLYCVRLSSLRARALFLLNPPAGAHRATSLPTGARRARARACSGTRATRGACGSCSSSRRTSTRTSSRSTTVALATAAARRARPGSRPTRALCGAGSTRTRAARAAA